MSILSEIAFNWNREAKREISDKYFYFFKEINQISSGKKCFVIGRKGSGKTAINEYIYNTNNNKTIFAKTLSFTDFPYNQLYRLKDTRYAQKSEYISIWKYIIFSSICEMMLENPLIDEDARTQLSLPYEKDLLTELPRKIEKWTGSKFTIPNITNSEVETLDWTHKIYLQEDIIKTYLDDSTYYILVDGLDDNYSTNYRNNPEDFQIYNNAITSLFKAVHSIKESAVGKKLKIYPIVFLRDDIFRVIRDNDKTKWGDLSITLDWDRDKIRNLLAFRLSKAANIESDNTLSFNDAWRSVFSKFYVGYGNKQQRQMHSFEFIDRMTQLRPRDYIEYIKACALKASDKKLTEITPEIVRSEEKAFSNYLRSETIDEIYPILPEIEVIFSVLTEVAKTTGFSIDDFRTTFETYVLKGEIQNDKNFDFVINTLFDFSVIGNLPNPNFTVFRYKNKDAKLNKKERLILNRGLYKALQIV